MESEMERETSKIMERKQKDIKTRLANLSGLFGCVIDQEIISMLAPLIEGDFRLLLLHFTVTEVTVDATHSRRRSRWQEQVLVVGQGATISRVQMGGEARKSRDRHALRHAQRSRSPPFDGIDWDIGDVKRGGGRLREENRKETVLLHSEYSGYIQYFYTVSIVQFISIKIKPQALIAKPTDQMTERSTVPLINESSNR